MVQAERSRRCVALVRMAATALLAGAFAVGAVACGSDGDSTGAESGSADEREIARVIDVVKRAFGEGDAEALCGEMSSVALEQLPSDGKGEKRERCVRSFGDAFENEAIAEDPNPRILGIDVKGDRAFARARTRTSSKVERAAFVKEGGEWKVLGWFTD